MHPNCTKRAKISDLGPMGWIGCVCCEKFWRDFVAWTFAQVRPVLHEFCKATKRSQMHPNSTKCTKSSVYGTMGWIGYVRCEKFRRDFMAWAFAPSFVRQPNGPKCTQIVRNTPNHQFRVQWGGSGAFGVKNSDATSFSNFCTSSAHFAPRFVWQPNGPKCTQIVWMAPKHMFMVQLGGSGAFVAKNSDATSWHELLN